MDTTVYKNILAWRGCEKLYLHSRSADVFFKFHTQNAGMEKVPAHKSILSAISPVFDAMFYGPNRQDGDINIVDAGAASFKEFLQFFYRSQVKLTIENVSEVMNLCKEYLFDDWQTVSMVGTDICTATLTIDDVCWGYEFAILFEMDELKRFCEKMIGENAVEIFRSSSFLSCQRNLLQHILQLNTFKCEESTVFDGCMAWAKAQCMQNNSNDSDTTELRAQMGNLFYEIRFGDMNHHDFQQRYQLHDGLFTLEEFRDITMMIVNKNYRPANFNRSTRGLRDANGEASESEPNKNRTSDEQPAQQTEIECKRRGPFTANDDHGRKISTATTKFISTSELNLKKISCYVEGYVGASINPKFEINAKIRIHENCNDRRRGTLISYVQTALPSNGVYNIRGSGVIELPKAIEIQAGVLYEIDVELDSYCKALRFENAIRLDDGTVIDFFDNSNYSVVNGMHFIG